MVQAQNSLLYREHLTVTLERPLKVLHVVVQAPHVVQRHEGVLVVLPKHPPLPLQGREIERLRLLVFTFFPQLNPEVVSDAVREVLVSQRNLGHLPQSPVLRNRPVVFVLTSNAVGGMNGLGAVCPQHTDEPVSGFDVALLALPKLPHPHMGLAKRLNPVEHFLLSYFARLVRLHERRLQGLLRLEVKTPVVDAIPAAQLRQRRQPHQVAAPKDLEDADCDALNASASLLADAPKLIEVLLVAHKAPLVAVKIVDEVLGKVQLQTHQVFLCLWFENEGAITLTLSLVVPPMCDLTIPGAVTSDKALATALVR
mmetsp:Transcript_18124/g.36303  ORF Transcript_18124/g.36303 Transcript_18124/m.36303 type:complete len:312 (-) Transcript_18124:136-1071(-)